MKRHYLSRTERNAPVSAALCGYQFSAEELDWSQKRLPYTFFPSLMTCDECSTIAESLVPLEHWSRRVEIYRNPDSGERQYTAFYPDRLVKGGETAPETTIFDPHPANPEPPGAEEQKELPYLEFQNIYDIMKLLAQSTQTAWLQPVLCQRPETAGLLQQAGKRLKRTAANEANPERRSQLKAAARQLQSLHAQIKGSAAGTPTAEQAAAFAQTWKELEALRCAKALSLRDVMAPFIDDPAPAAATKEESYAPVS